MLKIITPLIPIDKHYKLKIKSWFWFRWLLTSIRCVMSSSFPFPCLLLFCGVCHKTICGALPCSLKNYTEAFQKFRSRQRVHWAACRVLRQLTECDGGTGSQGPSSWNGSLWNQLASPRLPACYWPLCHTKSSRLMSHSEPWISKQIPKRTKSSLFSFEGKGGNIKLYTQLDKGPATLQVGYTAVSVPKLLHERKECLYM